MGFCRFCTEKSHYHALQVPICYGSVGYMGCNASRIYGYIVTICMKDKLFFQGES